MPKQIPFVVIPDEPLKAPLPDGLYGFISFGGYTKLARGGFSVPNPFPWMISFVKFEDGLCDFPSGGSDVGGELSETEVAQVLMVQLPEAQRVELTQKLNKHGIELVAA